MKKKELKFLCAGMCVCTAIAAGNVFLDKLKERSEAKEEQLHRIEAEETEALEHAEEAVAQQHEIYRVGIGNEADNEVEAVAEEGTAECEEVSPQTIEAENNLIIADVTNYVNIRSIPSEEGEILGKLYDDSVGRKYGEENGWYYIESGRVKGYVKAEFVLTGEEAEIRAAEVGKRLAEVTTTTLKVRKEATTESPVLGLVPGGDILNVLEETEGFIKVETEEGFGYVSADYVNVYIENVEAESREEEAARRKKEEEERKRAEAAAKEALKKQQAEKPINIGSNTNSGNSTNIGNSADTGNSMNTGSNTDSGNNASTGNSTNPDEGTDVGYTESGTDLGRAIADYAMQFIGNPYVYGGTSLTNGADCSGFVQSVYKYFGISLPRTSGEQGKAGSAVDGLANAKAGDLIWYSGHIGIYIGNGKVVHASSPKNGIITSEAAYRTILGIRRIV